MLDTSPSAPVLPEPVLQARPLALTFTGTGAAYFQIWIVDLLLTILTLGIYSAWGKVHRLAYFTRHTELDGVPFAFHGDAVPVLKGRVTVAALWIAAAYGVSYSFSFSIAMLVLLLGVLPLLLRGALRFRLDNTSWRGQRFGFKGTVPAAYLAFLAPIVLLMGAHYGLVLMIIVFPFLHAAIKRYRHAGVTYGGTAVGYSLSAPRFWRAYLSLYLLVGALLVCTVCVMWTLFGLGLRGMAGGGSHSSGGGGGLAVFLMLLAIMLIGVLLAAVPLAHARTSRLAWSHTHFPGVTIVPTMTFGGLFELHALNLFLTVITAGLYYPFAAVQAHRYKLAHLQVSTTLTFDTPVRQNWSVGAAVFPLPVALPAPVAFAL